MKTTARYPKTIETDAVRALVISVIRHRNGSGDHDGFWSVRFDFTEEGTLNRMVATVRLTCDKDGRETNEHTSDICVLNLDAEIAGVESCWRGSHFEDMVIKAVRAETAARDREWKARRKAANPHQGNLVKELAR